MKNPYEQPNLTISLFSSEDVIRTSGDGYEKDPWDEGFGG